MMANLPPAPPEAAAPAPARLERVLSEREREVLELVAAGCSGNQAAERLSLSTETVRTHVRNAIRKLNAHNRTHPVALALRDLEIRPPEA